MCYFVLYSKQAEIVCVNRALTLQLLLLKVSVKSGADVPMVQHCLFIVPLENNHTGP